MDVFDTDLSLGKLTLEAASIIESLEKLRNTHESLLKKHRESENATSEKLDLIYKNIEMIDLGLAEANILFEIDRHLICVDLELQRRKDSLDAIYERYHDLIDELYQTKEQLWDEIIQVSIFRLTFSFFFSH